jgi:hypothetical protein
MTRSLHAGSRRDAAGLCAALLLSLAGCQKDSTPYPTSDSTPPVIEWTVLNQADNGSQTSSVPYSLLDVGNATDIRVTCKAWDYEGGIQSITTTGTFVKECNTDGRSDPAVLVPLSTTHSKLPSGMVNTGSFTASAHHLPFDECSRYSGELKLTSVATNFLGNTTKSELSVTFSGP